MVVRYGNIFLSRGIAVSLDGVSPRDRLARALLAAGLPILTLGAGYAIDPRALVVVADQPAAERTKHRPPEDRFVPVRSVVA